MRDLIVAVRALGTNPLLQAGGLIDMTNIVMKYGSADGNVSLSQYTGYSELTSCDFSIGRNIPSATGTNKDRERSTPTISDITITKPRDDASGMLLYYALGSEAEKVEIVFLTTDQEGGKPIRTIDMEDVMISSHWPEHKADGSIVEHYSLNPTSVSITDKSYNSQNEMTGSRTTTYDFKQQKVTS